MSTVARARAENEQNTASDPAVSAFVSASAGSGKTKLLTDRLLRLMLGGAALERIQCLTFTKAAAAEMAVRLQIMIGSWVTAPNEELDQQLCKLALQPTEQLRQDARSLFARVLDLPGGMRIGTIHAFCQSLLRRFPLEAALSPYFELLDDAAAASLQRDARESILAGPDAQPDAINLISQQLTADGFAALLRELQSRRERLNAALAHGPNALEAAQRRVLGIHGAETEDDILREAIAAIRLPEFRSHMRKISDGLADSKNLATKVPAALAWLATAPPSRLQDWHDWAAYFLKQDGDPCNHKWLVSAALEKAHPGLRVALLEEQERVCAVLERLRTAKIAELSAALIRLAVPALASYDARKIATGAVDYADLIGQAAELLKTPGAAWVLYKLDGGLDHLLLDEVQDTAPDQWRIADSLTAEFFTGAGARDLAAPRTVFAVGDQKQSIFSFQGAAPQDFGAWRDHLRKRTLDAGAEWRDVTLDVSFRSTTPVLALVDAVFADPTRLGLRDLQTLTHFADRADAAGCVEVWPVVPYAAPTAAVPWEAPNGAHQPPRGPQVLADALADHIAQLLRDKTMLKSRGRPLQAGDILVLVRSRGPFDRALLMALKAKGVPVAGLDRMILTEQPAVADLLALCETLLLPSDDLSLAAVLTSPLGGLTDESLMHLALGRKRSLWDTLGDRVAERADWQAARSFIDALFAKTDFISPHALLSEALGILGGRARLYARLGPQAGEAIDELLNVAITFADRAPPSLQGFTHFVRQSGSEVKRQAEGASTALRIMTVHGAKGLQAPVVILPATSGLSEQKPTLMWAADPAGGNPVPLWGPRRETHDALMRKTLQSTIDAEREEHYRLLYVALTRAEDWLLICGWGSKRARQDCWYDVVHAACAGLGGVEKLPFTATSRPWPGEMLRFASPQREVVAPRLQAAPSQTVALPAWMGQAAGWEPAPLPPEPPLPASLAPSRPQDGQLGPVPNAASPLALRDASGRRFRRGQLLHSLLQHLPAVPSAKRAAAAHAYLRRPGTGLAPDDAALLAAELIALLEDPYLSPLFGPGSRAEVPLTGVVQTRNGPAVIGGLVDRLAILPTVILVADYKTNREPPQTPETTPALYLGQMAAYRCLLRSIFPDRPVKCALVWTRAARADWLPDDVLDRHAPHEAMLA